LSAAIVPFLVVAFVVLFGFPDDTERLFAWTITPSMTPMMLGAVYLGGAYFFVRATRAREWHTLKAGFVSVATFATLMGVATIIHWDRFNHDHVAFWLWTGLYFTTPFIVAATWLANRRTERPAAAAEPTVAPAARIVIGCLGAIAVVTGLFLYLFPERAIEVWPWALTPLTSRVLGSLLMLGLAGIGLFTDPRWSTARLMLQVQIVMMALILVGAARAHDDFDSSRPMTWLFLIGFAATLVAAVVFTLTMDARTRRRTIVPG
jgi:hypothetical protein